ncbi:hypothetical protein [Methylobacter sp. BlB1]|uniref:hypothetical protein n=1 Tax=unclassified Methylobacter TaxID=2635283 RepID=UPI001892D574|nr:hypothetical protein [Methylobacter sp. BlB1]MBF6649814.1 hypothetical protein [Methylobacter sp. BlB1]
MALELGELSGKLIIVNSEFCNKKNVNFSLNLKTPDAKITPLLKKRYALFFAPQVGGHFYQLGLISFIFAQRIKNKYKYNTGASHGQKKTHQQRRLAHR